MHSRAVVAIAAAACGLATAAHAFSKSVETACKGDYQNLCRQYKTNSPQLRACMESKANEISPNCINALRAAGEIDKKRVRR
jgi:hypothetical protein